MRHIKVPGVPGAFTQEEINKVKAYEPLPITLGLLLVDGEWEIKNNYLYFRGSMLDVARRHLNYLNEGN